LVAACVASLVVGGLVLGVGVNPAAGAFPLSPFPSDPLFPPFQFPETLVVNCSNLNVQGGPSSGLQGAPSTSLQNGPFTNLQSAINSATPWSTLLVSGVCYGNFTIGKPLTLQGPATLNGDGSGTVLTISTPAMVALNNLLIAEGSLGGIYVASGAVTLDDSTVADNTAIEGGGVYNNSTITITDSTVTDNVAQVDGGGIFDAGNMTINGSNVSTNNAAEGGGIEDVADSSLLIENSTVFHNNATYYSSTGNNGGGGIECNGSTELINSTVSYNTTQWDGGGIFGFLTATGSTVSDNVALVDGGGVYNLGPDASEYVGISITGNFANSNGGGIYNSPYGGTTMYLFYSSVTGNSANTGSLPDTNGGVANIPPAIFVNVLSNISGNSPGP
jgi:hypothetical protein